MSTNFSQLVIGSGPKKRDEWLTLDMCRGVDVFWDLRNRLPFVDASFDEIYCSHVLEHFGYRDLTKLLFKIHRIIRPGGSFLLRCLMHQSLLMHILASEKQIS